MSPWRETGSAAGAPLTGRYEGMPASHTGGGTSGSGAQALGAQALGAQPFGARSAPGSSGSGTRGAAPVAAAPETGSFSFRLLFSEPVATEEEAMREAALAVTGGTVTGARRVNGRGELWEIEVTPSGTGDVTVELEAGAAAPRRGRCAPRTGAGSSTT